MECGEEMVFGLMAGHMKTQHGRATEEIWSWAASPLGEEPRTYRKAFPTNGGPQSFPVEGCPGQAVTRMLMRVNFLHRHVQDTVVILEEINLPHPRCPLCDMLLPWRDINGCHLATAQCTREAERKIRRLAEEELQEISERAFQSYVAPLENVTVFKYMGKVMTAGDDDWTSVTGNLQKARKIWGRMLRILSWKGADPKVSG